MVLVDGLCGAAILSATSAEKPWYWKDDLLDTKCGGSGILGWCGIGCSVVVLAESLLLESVVEGQVIVPPDPKTMASLGQLVLIYSSLTSAFRLPLGEGFWGKDVCNQIFP